MSSLLYAAVPFSCDRFIQLLFHGYLYGFLHFRIRLTRNGNRCFSFLLSRYLTRTANRCHFCVAALIGDFLVGRIFRRNGRFYLKCLSGF